MRRRLVCGASSGQPGGGGALLVGWKLLNTPDYASVGPGIGFFGFFICLAAAILGLVLGLLWLAYFRPNVGAIGKVAAVCLGYVAVIAILSWAPWIPPQTYFAPEIVGVVAAADYTPDGVLHVKLEDRRALELQDRSQHDGQLSNVGKYAPLEGELDQCRRPSPGRRDAEAVVHRGQRPIHG